MAFTYQQDSYYDTTRQHTSPPPLPPHHYNAHPTYSTSPTPPPPSHRDSRPPSNPYYSTDSGYAVQVKKNKDYQPLPDRGSTGPPPVIYATAMPKQRTCMDKLCCGCCTCFPRWLRSVFCILFLLIVAFGIVIGVLAAIFKVPTVTFNGLQGDPTFNLTGSSTANFYFKLNITIDNQNIETLTFETIKAKAFYPNYPNQAIGGGQLSGVRLPSHSSTTIIFPFSLSADANDPKVQAILHDILSKCGVYGGDIQTIKVNYDVIPTIRIIGIAISPTISSSAKIPCPVDEQGSLGSIASLLPSDLATITGS